MKETVTNDLAGEVERLREQLIDLGEQVVVLTRENASLQAQIQALGVVMDVTATAMGVPRRSTHPAAVRHLERVK